MGEDVLVRMCLPAHYIPFGNRVLSLLENAEIPVWAAYWIGTYDRDYWRLGLVTPLIEEVGLIQASKRIHTLIWNAGPPARAGIESGWYHPIGVKYDEFQKMLKQIRTSRPLVNCMLTHCVVGDDLADLYMYRFPATYSYSTKKPLAQPRYEYGTGFFAH